MIAVDTNLFVFAHREDTKWHTKAVEALGELAESGQPWAIPWPCIHEFLASVTRPRYFDPPTPMEDALDAMANWIGSPSVHLLTEGPGHFDLLRDLIQQAKIIGPRVHDARIAAICLGQGVDELWSADRDMALFPALNVVNPLLAK